MVQQEADCVIVVSEGMSGWENLVMRGMALVVLVKKTEGNCDPYPDYTATPAPDMTVAAVTTAAAPADKDDHEEEEGVETVCQCC